jgi:hypothetical protein
LVEPFVISNDTATFVWPTVTGLGYVGEIESPIPASAIVGIPPNASKPTSGMPIRTRRGRFADCDPSKIILYIPSPPPPEVGPISIAQDPVRL